MEREASRGAVKQKHRGEKQPGDVVASAVRTEVMVLGQKQGQRARHKGPRTRVSI